jgi:hypothetical protein
LSRNDPVAHERARIGTNDNGGEAAALPLERRPGAMRFFPLRAAIRVASRDSRALLWIALAFVGHVTDALAAATAPTLDHVYPVAVQAGTTTPITAIGKFAPWPVNVWTDAPGISFHADTTAGKFTVEVGADTPVGPHLIRLYNENGASAPRFLVVTAEQQATEAEPNDEFAKAPTVERLPVTINGRLGKSGDVDSYGVKLEAGQTLIASLEAFVLGSPVDAVLRLVDARGVELALNHDDGRTFDPLLTWTAKTAGTYVLQVFGFAYPATADVKFTGSDACVYRLHLSRGPQLRYTLPLGIPRATPAKLRVFGWNLGALSGCEISVDGSSFPADASQANWKRAEFENSLSLALGDGPELLEPDLVTRSTEAPAMAAPFAITGCIDQVGEEDRFRFNAIKDEKLVLEIQSATLGFPLDAWLAIQDATGKELTRNDDGPNADPVFEWAAPKTGSYVAVVGSVLHRGGADHLYRLSVQRPRPVFKAIVAESGFMIAPAKTAKIKITARRMHGFKSKLTASVTGLPEGVTASPLSMDETDKEITMELTASPDAAAFSGPIQIRLREDESEAVHLAVHELTSTSLKNGVPQGFRDLLIRSTDQLWLTVTPAAALKPAEEK